jgi:hypothetical protein
MSPQVQSCEHCWHRDYFALWTRQNQQHRPDDAIVSAVIGEYRPDPADDPADAESARSVWTPPSTTSYAFSDAGVSGEDVQIQGRASGG